MSFSLGERGKLRNLQCQLVEVKSIIAGFLNRLSEGLHHSRSLKLNLRPISVVPLTPSISCPFQSGTCNHLIASKIPGEGAVK